MLGLSMLRLFSLLTLISFVAALASTDTITWGGDVSRSGYQNNHNMDPAVVGSSQFGQLFRTQLPGIYGGVPEQTFAAPLVYTTSDGIQYVYLATQQNNIYKLNAKTGVIVAQRNLHIPFLTSDLDGCVDINPHIGSTATGVIDPATGTWYLTTKTYVDQNPNGAKGRPNGRYYIHAISVDDLSERANFPVDLEGQVARNNPERSFGGGIHHQRPALLHQGQYVYAGFASHCVQYNFTGWIMGWDKSSGQIVERYATEGAGVKNTVPGGGVWMSGGGLASDGRGSMFFATGNGYASQLNGIPVNGRRPPTSLEEAAVHMTINGDGTLTPVDFFMPWEKTQLDGADKDLGTSPLQLLPSQFSCGNVRRMGVVTGKSGKTYWLDMDNMGGYQNGPNKLDAVLQVYQNENSVYAGAGVYPLEGGYIYINVIQYQTHVFKFSCDGGVPSFTKVADSPEKNAFILGVGHGTTTSLNDQPGTGLVWVSDVEGANLRVYNAIPQNGQLTLIKAFNVVGTTKFNRPVFGDGIVYQTTHLGYFYGFGSPVNLAFNCSSPYDFGTVSLNDTSGLQSISCQANVDSQISSLSIAGNPNFVLGNSSTFPVTVPKGSNYTFQAAFTPQQVGPLSSDAVINITTAAAGVALSNPVRLKGTGQSSSALLAIAPNTVSFDGVITGEQAGGVTQSVIVLNQGNSNLTITGLGCSASSEAGPFEPVTPINGSVACGPFTFTRLPSQIAGNGQATVSITFNPSSSANYATFLNIQSTGGKKTLSVVGVAGTYPTALLEFEKPDGSGWVKYDNSTPFSFGDVLENTSRNLKMRLTNTGGNSSARLSVTVSKPPFGVGGLIGAQNQVDLAEGTTLGPGENATATLYCSAPKSQINVASYSGTAQWTMNLGDPAFGKQIIHFACNAVSEQSEPRFANGTSQYRYTGCFKENNPGRQLKTQIYSTETNTNMQCVKTCADAGYAFAGTQYLRECWCGPTVPVLQVDDANCNFPCTGDINQICGGNGIDHAGTYISVFVDPAQAGVVGGPFVNPGVNGYTSLGCYTEATQGRALAVGKGLGSKTSVANCTAACQGYAYAGVEWSQECYCGDTLGAGAKPAPLSECNMVCAGNSSELCGAGSRLNLYALKPVTSTSVSASASASSSLSSSALSSSSAASSATSSAAISSSAVSSVASASSSAASTADAASISSVSASASDSSSSVSASPSISVAPSSVSASSSVSPSPIPTGPVSPARVGSYAYVDCYTEATNGRALNAKTLATDTLTLEMCATACAGYAYFAAEYARECYCGNTLMAGSIVAKDGRCKMTCKGNNLQYCGGSNGLSLYAFVNSTAGVSASASASSLSTVSSIIVSSTSANDSSSSALASSSAASSLVSSAVSSAASIASSSYASVSEASSSTSSSISAPSSSSTIPSSSAAVSSSAAISSSSSASSTSVSASSSIASSSSAAPSPSASTVWTYLGCANETNPRALNLATTASNTMTIQSCQAFCLSKNMPLAGLEYGRECYCGTALGSYSTVGFTGCNMACAGSPKGSSDICGGSSRLSVYNYTAYVPPQLVASVNTYKLQGCYQEPTNGGRALGAYSFVNATGMTAEWCVNGCQAKGYGFAGMEYGQECWCDKALNTASTKIADSSCNMLCPGNQREYCGAGSRIAVYKS